MPHSLSQTATVTCPHCSRAFGADIWLVVDASERPDLLARARDGTLHRVVCPHCGQPAGEADAPLLIYRPDTEPRLIFFPAQQTSAEQDREHAAGLLAHLREALGDAWRDEWVEGMPVVPRPLLPAALAEDPKAAIEDLAEQVAQAIVQGIERLREEEPETDEQSVVGARNLLIRGDVKGSVIAIGDQNVLVKVPEREPVTRYTDIACPRRVWVETPRVSVVVRLTVQPPAHSAAVEELALRADLPVRVRVDAPAFAVLNEAEQETVVRPEADSPPLVFDLRPQDVGPTRVNFDFFQDGNPVGTASVPVEVTAHEVSATAESHFGQKLRLEPDADPPDRMLYITYERFREQPALVFTLFRAGEVGRTFTPVPLEADPRAHADRLCEHLTLLTQQQDPTAQAVLGRWRVLPAEDVDRRLRQLGQTLWRDLIPRELKAVYAAERNTWRDGTLLIVSDEPHIPWELVWPYEPGGWQDDAPWCITMRLARWLRRDFQGNGHEAPPTRLRLRALACLAPTDSGLPAAQKERAFLRRWAEQHNLRDVSPEPPTWSEVMDLLEGGTYDWLHAAAHGNFYPAAPEADSALWLQDKRALTPDHVVGPIVEGHINARRPAFVFNACHSGRQGWALTRLGGWANRLISSGAGLFLASLWTVTDDRAVDFAMAFYRELAAGNTFAEAVRQARLAARRSGDPTWLAYSLYAHPNARVGFSA